MPTAGEIIERVRTFRGMSRDALCQITGYSAHTLYRLEHNDPRIQVDKIAKAAAALELEFDWATKTVSLPPDLPSEAFFQTGMDVKTIKKARVLGELADLVNRGLLTTGEVVAAAEKAAASRSNAAQAKVDAKHRHGKE